jgi:hypothetical protein
VDGVPLTVKPPVIVAPPVKVARPVALKVPLRVRPPKVGVEDVAIFWMVLTAPEVTVKFVLLKLAMPFWEVEASSMVIEAPATEALLIEIEPDKPLRDVTVPLPEQLPQEGKPAAITRQLPLEPMASVFNVLVAEAKRRSPVV